MSVTIDEKVVEMRFDNKQFENNIQTSLSTLDKLKQSLNLSGASKGLEDVDRAASRIDMSGLGNAVETVRAKFSALQVMGITALTNITNSAINAGKKIVSALTIDPIKSGFSEYETQMNAVQTILANTESKGATIDDVNNALGTLNTYADKTIYNFTEMTRNIGTFTAAGVGLDDSVSAIQGIANLAAVSGSTSQQASTAMYQLSQALSSGSLKLQDWNSVVNSGMGGQVFQDALKRTAEAHGVNVEKMIKDNGSFRESLSEGWITAEILTETLKQFTMATEEGSAEWEEYKKSLMEQGYTEDQAADILKLANTATDAATKVKTLTQMWDTLQESAQSGWTQSWEIVVGDFEEAKELFTEISDTLGALIGESAEARNNLLEGAMTSSWEQLSKKIDAAGISAEGYEEKIKDIAAKEGYNIEGLLEDYGELGKLFETGELPMDVLTTSITRLTSTELENLKITDEFAEKIKETASENGYNIDGLLEDYGTLNHLFATGELSCDVFTKTIGKMSDAQLLNAGYTESDIENLRSLGEVCDLSNESMSKLMSTMSNYSGRELLIQSLWNSFDAAMAVIKPVKEALREIFPPMTSEQLYSIIEGLKNLTEKLIISDETADKIKRTFKGVFAIFRVGVDAVKALFGGFVDLVKYIAPAGGGLLDFTANLGDSLVAFSDFIRSSDVFNKTIQKITGAIGFVIEKIKSFKDNLSEAFSKFSDSNANEVSEFADNVKSRFEPFAKIGEAAKKIFEGIGKVVDKLAPIFYGLAEAAGKAFSALSNAILNADFDKVIDIVNTGLLGTLVFGIKKFIDSLTGATEGAGGFFEGIVDVLDGVKGSLEAWQGSLKSGTLLKIASAVGILAVALIALSFIDSEKLSTALGAITGLFIELFGSMTIMQKTMGAKGFATMGKVTKAMIGISAAVLILAIAMKKIADLEWSDVIKGLVAISVLSSVLVSAARKLSMTSGKLFKGALGLVVFAGAILVLAEGVEKLGAMDMNSLIKGLGAVGALMLEVAAFLKLANFGGVSVGKGLGIVALAVAINILAKAVTDMSAMSWEELGKGLAAVGAILLELAVFTKLVGNPKGIITTSVAMVIIGAAMLIFADAVAEMSKMSWEEIGKGLATMAGVLILVTGAMRLLPKNMLSTGAGFIIVAYALTILAEALNSMGGMSWEQIGKGLATLGGSLLIISLAMLAMKKALPGAAALLVVSAALTILVPVLQKLGAMSWSEIGKGLVALAGAFTILGVAGLLLGPLVPAILGLAAAIALLGVGCLAVGAGVVALSAGLAALSVSGAAGAAALVTIVTAILGLIPLFIQKLGEGLIALAQVIADGAPVIGQAILNVVLAIINVLTNAIPPLIECVNVLLTALLDFLVSFIPKLIDAGMKLIAGVLKGIADNIKDVTVTAIKIITEFIDGIAEGIPSVIQSGINLIISFINGMADGIRNNTDDMIAAVDNLMDSVVYAVKQWLAPFISKGKEMIQNMIDGIKDKVESAKKAVGDLIGDVIDGITGTVDEFIQAGKDLIQGLIDGITNMASKAVQGIKNFGGNLISGLKDVLGINSPSKEFAEIGRYCDEGLIVGLKAYANKVVNVSKDVGRGALDAMGESLVGVSDLINSGLDPELTIRPVMDLTGIESGIRSIDGMMSDRQTLTLDTRSIGTVPTSMQRLKNRQNSNDLLNAINGLRKDMSDVSHNTYQINGISYSEGSDVANAIKTLVRNTKLEGRS